MHSIKKWFEELFIFKPLRSFQQDLGVGMFNKFQRVMIYNKRVINYFIGWISVDKIDIKPVSVY